MKKLLLVVFLLVAWFSDGATIKFYTDYPNTPTPLGSDFLLFQRNSSYVNSSQSQALATWFSNPTFTGNVLGGVYFGDGSGLTNIFTAATNTTIVTITNNTFVNTNIFISTSNAFFDNSITTNAFITNLTVNVITNTTLIVTNVTIQQPGGATNLNLTPLAVMYTDVNDAESSIPNASGILTNNGTGGIGFTTKIQFDEIDANLAYLTNFFTGLTNYNSLGTDGNGLLTLGSGAVTNISITNAYIQNLTNNTFVNTNLFISTSNAYFNNIYSTNTFFDTNFTQSLAAGVPEVRTVPPVEPD